MTMKQVSVFRDDFFGNRTFTSSADANGWATVKVGGGSPTAITLDTGTTGTGEVQLLLDTTSEVQSVSLYHKDTKSFAVSQLRTFRAHAYFSAAPTIEAGFIGMAAAHNSTLASVAEYCGFRLSAAGAINVYANDGSGNTADVSTGFTLGTSPLLLEIDFTDLTNVKFYVSDVNTGALRRVCKSTTVTMSAYNTSNHALQPYIRHGRTIGTEATSLNVDVVDIEFNRK